MPPEASDRTKNARRAQLYRSAKHDGRAVTANARRTFRESFNPPEQPGETAADCAARLRKGEAAYRAYMSQLSVKAVKAKAARRAQHLAELARLAGSE